MFRCHFRCKYKYLFLYLNQQIQKFYPIIAIDVSKKEYLLDEKVIGIFPEGTRNRTNEELLKFRHGAVAIAKKTGTPILPFAIIVDA